MAIQEVNRIRFLTSAQPSYGFESWALHRAYGLGED